MGIDATGGIRMSGGMAVMNGQTMDLETLIFSLNAERANLVEQGLVDQASTVKQRNSEMAATQKTITEARQLMNELKEMEAVKTELQNLKATGMEKISTGDRVILGRRPDIMLKLEKWGVSVPNCGGGPYDRFAKEQAAKGAAPYDKQEYKDMAGRLASGWEELSAGEMDVAIRNLESAMAAKTSPEVAQFMTSHGMTFQAGSSDKVNGCIESLKGYLDSLNSSSQMDMIRLQGLTQKRDQSFEMITNLMSKFAKTKDAIVGNLR